MKTKSIFIMFAIFSLIGLLIVSLCCSYVLNGLGGKSWITWEVFVYPLPLWVISIPIFYTYIKFLRKGDQSEKLASSKFMEKSIFMKKFSEKKENDNFKSNWVVKTNFYKKGKLNFYQTKTEGHALVIGSTGSGKTSLLLDANIQLFARSDDKPSMIISDPKGELFNNHSKTLRKQGYEVLTINLRDYEKSHHWNPLETIWNLWNNKESSEMSKENALNRLSELATTLFPPQRGNGDSFFEESAAIAFQFFTILYLEKSEENKEFGKEGFNIANIVSNIHQTTFDELQELLGSLPLDSKAMMVGGSNIKGSEKTVSSTLQTCVTRLRIYTDPIIKRVTAETNIKIDISKPQAIFIIVPDESKTKYPFISLFISEYYKELISLATNSIDGKLTRRFYFLLDEFGNVPKIPGMDAMITVARSRNIFFMLLLQNYSQLNEKYSNNTANTIISNCAYEFFLLTSDVDTAKKFSQKLGQKSLVTKSKSASSNEKGISSSSSESERTRYLVHPDELMKLNFGEYILSMQREQPMKLNLVGLWEWNGYEKGSIEIKSDPMNEFNSNHLINFITIDEEIEEIEDIDLFEFMEKIEKEEIGK